MLLLHYLNHELNAHDLRLDVYLFKFKVLIYLYVYYIYIYIYTYILWNIYLYYY